MSKIHIICGKSGTGKDTFCKALFHKYRKPFWMDTPYTSRPSRAGEVDGTDYFFRPAPKDLSDPKIIEFRTYQTMQGEWCYWHEKLNDSILKTHEILTITTADTFSKFADAYGRNNLDVYEIVLPPDMILKRMMEREAKQPNPNYTEVERRHYADNCDWDDAHKNPMCVSEKLGIPYFKIDGTLLINDEVLSVVYRMRPNINDLQ